MDATGRTVALVASVPTNNLIGEKALFVIKSGEPPQRMVLPAGMTVGREVSITPAGDRIAFVARSGSGTMIAVASTAGGTVTLFPADVEGCTLGNSRLPIDPFFSCVTDVHLVADGSAVVYTVVRPQPFVILSPATGTSMRLPMYWSNSTASPQRAITRASELVFTSFAPLSTTRPDFENSSMTIVRMKLDGSSLLGLGFFSLTQRSRILNPTVSANGRVIAFLANRASASGPPSTTYSLWTMGGDVTFQMAIATQVDQQPPSVSGDGALVAYAKGGQVHVIRSDGSGEVAVTNFQQSAAHSPALSEDGRAVVFRMGPKPYSFGAVHAMNTDGSGLRPVYAPRMFNHPNGVQQITEGFISPGSLFTAYGANLGPDGITVPVTLPAPTQLAGVSLLVNGEPVPLLAVTPWQVNAHLPQHVPAGDATIQLRFADGTATPVATVPVWTFNPGFFSYQTDYGRQAAAFHAGTGILADRDNPAAAGEVLEVYMSGLGPTEPLVPAGTPSPWLPLGRAFMPLVHIGGMHAPVFYAGLTPGFIGLYQINVAVPAGLMPGQQSIAMSRFNGLPATSSMIWVK